MAEPAFSVKVLQSLRADGYRPHAWWKMLTSSWAQARVSADAHPGLARDWRWLTGSLGVATLGLGAYTARRQGGRVAWRGTALLALINIFQAGDIYVHLGLHRRDDGAIHARLGAAMPLTAAREWVGAVIGARLLIGAPVTDDEALVALALIVATDIADGWIARRQAMPSPLGRYLDGAADMLTWTTLTVTQQRRSQVPTWFLLAFGLRWGLPLILGFGRTFMTAAPMRLDPSRFARIVGAAQVAVAATAIGASLRAGKPEARWWGRAKQGLLATTGVLLVAATIRHCARLLWINAPDVSGSH
jgi:phosphatidylglycerophosphate synthase